MKEYFFGDKRIAVYDDLFPVQYKSEVYQFAISSLYRIAWADSSEQEKLRYRCLNSEYSEFDLENLGFIKELKKTPAISEMDGYHIEKVVMNLSTPSDINFIHTHAQSKVLLYYVNLSWEDGWFGETLFYDNSKKDIVFSSAYTPGRLIAFDAFIPHTIRPQSILAQFYRFSLAVVLDLD